VSLGPEPPGLLDAAGSKRLQVIVIKIALNKETEIGLYS